MNPVDQCRKQLQEIPMLHALASECLTPGNGGHGSSSSELTIGINLEAIQYVGAWDILLTLEAWETLVREDRGFNSKEGPRGSIDYRVKTVCEFLQVHFEWLMDQEIACEFIREVGEIHWRGLAVTNQIPVKNIRVDCPNDLEDGSLCGGRIILKSADKGEKVQCRYCRRDWIVGWLIKVAKTSSKSHMWVDIEVLSQHYKITHNAIRLFARRYNVTIMGRKPMMYSFKEFDDTREMLDKKMIS
jgi:hypothetical protein